MTTITLFGLALAPLYAAIAEVESNNGKTSRNIYQIDEDASGYIQDVNRIRKFMCLRTGIAYRPFTEEAKYDRRSSEMMMLVYWNHYGTQYEKSTGRRVTYEILARIHNGGPVGYKKNATFAYWNKVEAAMRKAGAL